MSSERVFAIVRMTPETGPPYTGCRQVVLRLLSDGTFYLLDAQHEDDGWGEQAEQSTRYSGTYEEQGDGVVCRADHTKTINYSYDHTWGKRDRDIRHRDIEERIFEFERDGQGRLRCPLEPFVGEPMRRDVEPHPGVR